MSKSKPQSQWPASEAQLHHALVSTLGLEKTEAERLRNTQKAWKKFETRLKKQSLRAR